MTLKFKNYNEEQYVPKFQLGGEIPATDVVSEPAPVETPEESAQSDMDQLIQAAAQAVLTQDCQLAMQVCLAVVEAMSQAPEAMPQEQPVYKMGGKLSRTIKKD